MEKEKDTKSSKYLLTINNPSQKGYTHDRIKNILLLNFTTFDYCCMADEQGSTYHTHVFVYFRSRVRFSMIKHYFPGIHIDSVKSTVSDCVNYVAKKGRWENTGKSETKIEGTFEEMGKRPPDTRGKRGDMSELYNMILDGMTNTEILAVNQDYIMHIDKLDKLRTTIWMEKFEGSVRNVHVTYISGKTGTGKTSGVLKKHGASNVYRICDYKHPFDNYNKPYPVICFDEFESSLSLSMMRNLTDIYPMELPSRYANKVACYEKVYIISNLPLEMQYLHEQERCRDSWEAFLRRINEVVIYTGTNIITYRSVKEYFGRDEGFHKLSEDEEKDMPFK